MQPPSSPSNPFASGQPSAASAAGRFSPREIPNSTIPKTLGILNLIFGVIFMLAGVGTVVQYVVMPMFGEVMEVQQQEVTKALESQQELAVQKLLEEQKAAESEDEKAAIQTQIDQVQNQPRITPPNMAGMMGMTDRRVMIWGVVNGLSGALLNLLMIISGVGLLLLKGWGRSLALWVAGLKLLRLLVANAYYCFVCVPIIAQSMMGFMQQVGAQGGPGQPQASVQMGTMFAGMYWAQAIGFALFASIYPIICIVMLTRSRVKAAFINTPLTTPQ